MEEKWEYKTVVFRKRKFLTSQLDWREFNEQLNQYGDKGWELVSSVANGSPFITGSVVVILKKRTKDI